jgi:hypothetical protein
MSNEDDQNLISLAPELLETLQLVKKDCEIRAIDGVVPLGFSV